MFEATDGTGTHYVAVEISFTGDRRDYERATRNAELLTRFTGMSAQAVIASVRNDRETEELVDAGAVSWYPLPEYK